MIWSENRPASYQAEQHILPEFAAHPKLEAALENTSHLQAIIACDIDDTLVTGCIPLHIEAAQKFGRRRTRYEGPYPTLEDILQFGTVQAFFAQHTESDPEAHRLIEWANHLRKSAVFHRELKPIHPDLPSIFAELEAAALLPALTLTARPPRLERLSEDTVFEITGKRIPALPMPVSVAMDRTSDWKRDQLLWIARMIPTRQPIVLLDDSIRNVTAINALHHPRLKAYLYREGFGAEDQPVFQWETLKQLLGAELAIPARGHR